MSFFRYAVLGSILLSSPFARAEVTVEVISRSFESRPFSGGDASAVELSADGKFAVFISYANGLATNDNNGLKLDVFLRDVDQGTTRLVSRGHSGASGRGDSYNAMISADGRYVVFESMANDLVPDDDNGGADIFLYDRTIDALTSLTKGAEPGLPSEAASLQAISSDARFIVFESTSTDLAPSDSNNAPDLFVLDRQNGEIRRITTRWDGGGSAAISAVFETFGESNASVSDDGNYVAHLSAATDLIQEISPRLTNAYQLYLWERAAGTNRLISTPFNSNERSSARSPALSANGRSLAYLVEVGNQTRLQVYDVTARTNKVIPPPTETTGSGFEELALSNDGQSLVYSYDSQIYLYDVVTGDNQLISGTTNGVPGSNSSSWPLISADGQMIVFTSFATNLTADPASDFNQVFSFNRASGEIRLLSRNAAGLPARNDILFPALSADGSRVAFTTIADNLTSVDNSGLNDVILVSTSEPQGFSLLSAASPTALSQTANRTSRSQMNALSLDGRYVVFTSEATDLVANDTNGLPDLFVRDLRDGTIRMVSLTLEGTQRQHPVEFNGISANGATIIFTAVEWIGGSNVPSVLAYATASGSLQLASTSATGEPIPAGSGSVTADGRQVAFIGLDSTIYVRDLVAQTTTTEGTITPYNQVRISPAGKYLVYSQSASGTAIGLIQRSTGANIRLAQLGTPTPTLPPNPFTIDDRMLIATRRGTFGPTEEGLYLYDLVSFVSNVVVTNVTGPIELSPNGDAILFQRRDSNVVTGLYDIGTSNVTLLNLPEPGGAIRSAAFSADGRFIALARAGDTNAQRSYSQIYLYDRVLTNFTMISTSIDGDAPDGPSSSPSISADGRVITFDSLASNLTTNDLNQMSDVFAARISPVDQNNNGLEDGWEQLLGGSLDPTGDPDGDGATTLQEFLAGTDPLRKDSVFSLRSSSAPDAKTLSLAWPVRAGRSYQLQFRPAFGTGDWTDVGGPLVPVQDGLVQTDVSTGVSGGFYRLVAL